MTAFLEKRCRVLRRSMWQPSPDEAEPDISFTDSRFRRRLSLLSRMTIKVLYDIMPLDDTPVYFISFRGEVNQQFKVNRMLIEEGDILPAAFSLSVFNAPPALASMALNLKGGYSAVYPGANQFRSALLGASAALEAALWRNAGRPAAGDTGSGSARYVDARHTARLALVYADEPLIPEYQMLEKENSAAGCINALAFAVLLSASSETGPDSGMGAAFSCGDCETPQSFYNRLVQ